ncbi:anthranilate synthase component I family protein [Goodfellowiella coeruleoviolacea]|uniref:Anthranilate synthase component 1 n=1 Tax=Goodfellowiella coeruleoviolacea TaxID=334858 RepID=A0AAE3GJH4_9PSEU|nr:anthranilate synthase component I family protein [Goodfellowiella coeruleoviolacea]MCP2169330.1 anthranilate synthase component 1 [Goodfellowiella coeruleoviolacea]
MTVFSPTHPGPLLTTRTRVVPGAAPAFTVYNRLADRYGPGSVFLLESLGGPDSECRRSFVGVNPVLRVRLAGSRLRWSGSPLLVTAITTALARAGLLDRPGPCVDLPDRRRVWDVLRGVRDVVLASTSDSADARRHGLRLGLFGYLGYDLAGTIERLPRLIPADHPEPDLDLALYQGVVEQDRATGTAVVTAHNNPAGWPVLDVAALADTAARPPRRPPEADRVPSVPPPVHSSDSTCREDYLRAVDRALEHVAAGDVYQVQLGHERRVRSAADPRAVYARLRAANPSPYCYLAPFGTHTALGASPELFVATRAGQVVMRPIAGTAPRGGDPAEDAARVAALRADEKEQAEHVMLVDLCRNDIGRICARDGLAVPELLTVEPYSHVHHLVSTVTGVVRAGCDEYDVITSAFPAGTMTGAPKIRAMEVIESLETSRRGMYAGALGLIGFSGEVDLALCIRGATARGGRFSYRASAGVVADSVPAGEWAETCQKLAAVHWAVTGAEVCRAGTAR